MTTRVLHVINTAEVGGGSEHLVHLVGGLVPHGFSSAVVVGRDGPTVNRLRQAGAPVAVIGPLRGTAVLTLGARFRAAQPDLVHLHGSRSGLAGVIAARLSGIWPVIYTAHVFAFRRQLPRALHWAAARAEALTCRFADRVICLSQSDLVEAAACGIPTDRFTVVANGVAIALVVTPNDRRSEFGLDPGVPVVGMISRLVPQKDPITFLRMARLVTEMVPDVRFLLVGDGPLRRAVERAVQETGLSDRVIVTGFRSDVNELLQTMDVVVLTSLWEGLPLTLLEAMAAARPVVATLVAGSSDVVVNGETGFLVPPHDPVQIAAAVTQLIQNPALRQAMGQQGRTRVARDFSLSRMVQETVNVYRAVLHKTG